jgi:threonine/homoserine/homoserine lactone efflux protein
LRSRIDVHLLVLCVIAFVIGFVASMPLAGPISVLVVTRAARREFEGALRIGLGAATVEGLYAAVAFWGFATLLSRHDIVVPISHGVTAVVLLALGVRFVAFVPHEKTNPNENKTGNMLLGFSISALNPTLLVTWSAAVAFLYSKGLRETSGAYAIPFGICAGAGVGTWFVIMVKLLRKYEGKHPPSRLARVVRFLGIVLVGLGVWSGVQLVQWLGGKRDTPARAYASLCFSGADSRAPRHGRGD